MPLSKQNKRITQKTAADAAVFVYSQISAINFKINLKKVGVWYIISLSEQSDKARFLNGVFTGGYVFFYMHKQKCRVYERRDTYEK